MLSGLDYDLFRGDVPMANKMYTKLITKKVQFYRVVRGGVGPEKESRVNNGTSRTLGTA